MSTPTKPYRIACSRSETIGGFGLVTPRFTRAYQSADLALHLPYETFTNLYHRIGGLGIDSQVAGRVHQVAGWASVVRVIAVENDGTAWHSVENRESHQT